MLEVLEAKTKKNETKEIARKKKIQNNFLDQRVRTFCVERYTGF